MFPSFIGILDIQSWWEVPSIAHFCSLFRAAFNLLDFDIEELEEALLTDGATEESASSLLTELIVRLLCGCLGNNDISAFNYQMFLRRLFRQKCQETGRYNPFNTDIDFQFLPLRTKVEILYALCDFRLDADDVFDLFKNLEAESLRVEPLGWDDNSSAYWYFYGTRLYREDYKVKSRGRKGRRRNDKKQKNVIDELEDDTERVWQVVCFTETDWIHLTDKFKCATTRTEKDLYLSLSENFLPEIPRLFQEKERLQRKRLLESVPRRMSTRVQKNKLKEEKENNYLKNVAITIKSEPDNQQQEKTKADTSRRERAKRREKIRSHSSSSGSIYSFTATDSSDDMWSKRKKRKLEAREASSSSSTAAPPVSKPSGRQTNNSLACATGQILIPDIQEPSNPTRKKMKTSQIYELLQEDLHTGMYKVLEQLRVHEDAWPFLTPVEENYAPNYYSVIRRPMNLDKMEERLNKGHYKNFSMFKNDFYLIVQNCRLYNGQDSDYTKMVDRLETVFVKLTQRYFDRLSSSDDDVEVEFPVQNPSPRKQAAKSDKRGSKANRNKSNCNDTRNSDSSPQQPSKRKTKQVIELNKKVKLEKEGPNDPDDPEIPIFNSITIKTEPLDLVESEPESDDSTHSSLDKTSNATQEQQSYPKRKKKGKVNQSLRKTRKEKHKRLRQKRKHSKHDENKVKKRKVSRRLSVESQRSKSSTLTVESDKDEIPEKRQCSPELDFFKDKFDKIKERRRGAQKNDSLSSGRQNEKSKSNLSLPEKDKNLNLKETIEKLKAKSEKNDTSSLYSEVFEGETSSSRKEKKKTVDSESQSKEQPNKKKTTDEYEFVDEDEEESDSENKVEESTESIQNQTNAKNESATEALEQAVKDISKWLDDAPKLSEFSSNSNSPLQIPNQDEYISTFSKQDDENSRGQTDKGKKDGNKKRALNKDSSKSLARRKEVQRTIERLQPGKSKGNLITNIPSTSKPEESIVVPSTKTKETKSSLIMRPDEGSHKLSLGTVLPTVGFGLGKQHNFTNEPVANANNVVKVEVVDTGTMTSDHDELIDDEKTMSSSAEDVEISKENIEYTKTSEIAKQCQEKATPNLSAWFKAFGAPKSTTSSSTTTSTVAKKKIDELDQDYSKLNDSDPKNVSPRDKNEQMVEDSMIPDGSESPIPNLSSGIRARRTSTGSSISERSSFSQDLDSPRHQPSHPSPLLRSPASPRTEDHQKSFPLMNVTVRVGFYQDTTSVKSSPEKSCSPREAPQSPYPAYSQHVYATSANSTISNNQSNIYPIEGPSKSPLPAYAQTQSSYYENTKSNTAGKSSHHDEAQVYSSDNAYQQPASPYTGSFSPGQSPYSHHSQHSPYSHMQNSPQSFPQPMTVSNIIQSTDRRIVVEKSSIFPVKKRTYNEIPESTDYESSVQIRELTPSNSDEMNLSPADDSSGADKLTITSNFQGNNILNFSSPNNQTNNPSVITSASSKNLKKPLQYVPETLNSSDLSSKSTVIQEDVQSKVAEVRTQYSDFVSDYSLKKTQVNDFSMVGLTKSHVESGVSMYQEPQVSKSLCNPSLFSEMKNMSKALSQDFMLKEKPVDMINMGYANKILEASKNKDSNVDMVNMGYLLPDTGDKLTHHIAKISSNTDETRNLRNLDIYSAQSSLPYTGRSEQNSQAIAKVTTSNEYVENNKRFNYEKSHSVLQYPRTDISSTGEIELVPSTSNMVRTEGNLRSEFSDTTIPAAKSSVVSNYKDWRMEPMRKIPDAHNLTLYKENQSNKNDNSKLNLSQLHSSIQNKMNEMITYDPSVGETEETLQRMQSDLKIPIFRAVIEISSSIKPENQQATPEYNLRRNVNLNLPVLPNPKADNFDRSTPLNSANIYKPHNQSSHPIDQSLMNLPNLPQIMERYVKDDRMLNSYQVPSTTSIPLVFPKNVASLHSAGPSSQMYQAASIAKSYNREIAYSSNIQPNLSEPISLEADKKTKARRKKSNAISTPSSTPIPAPSFHSYPGLKPNLSSTEQSIALKPPNLLSSSAFNFGAPGGLTSSLYGEGSCYLDDLRNSSSNQYVAANYMAAHQRTVPEVDKTVKPAHQQAHTSGPFQFLAHPQARPGYPLVGMDPSSTLYQQYLQHQEELIRHSTSQMMGLFPAGYHSGLGVRQPFDSITRHSWL